MHWVAYRTGPKHTFGGLPTPRFAVVGCDPKNPPEFLKSVLLSLSRSQVSAERSTEERSFSQAPPLPVMPLCSEILGTTVS
jgi:hypothetical protein